MNRLQVEQDHEHKLKELYAQAADIEVVQDRLAEDLEAVKQEIKQVESSLQSVQEWGIPCK